MGRGYTNHVPYQGVGPDLDNPPPPTRCGTNSNTEVKCPPGTVSISYCRQSSVKEKHTNCLTQEVPLISSRLRPGEGPVNGQDRMGLVLLSLSPDETRI